MSLVCLYNTYENIHFVSRHLTLYPVGLGPDQKKGGTLKGGPSTFSFFDPLFRKPNLSSTFCQFSGLTPSTFIRWSFPETINLPFRTLSTSTITQNTPI